MCQAITQPNFMYLKSPCETQVKSENDDCETFFVLNQLCAGYHLSLVVNWTESTPE